MRGIGMTISGGGGPGLEARLDLPEQPGRYCGVVVCHPHPLYGGDMHNNVVVALSRFLTGAGMAALRFNFRGVGRSGGAFDNGAGETDDARSALAFLAGREEILPGHIGIAGYSFGGMVAMAAGEADSLAGAIALISPVVFPGALKECTKPKFIITGDADTLISAEEVSRAVAGMAEPKTAESVPGADHFWRGQEEEMAGKVAEFFVNALRLPGKTR